ncbi:MAG: endonuclease III, partial [Clostridia bacterium]|nr:endonuclease III [Clostridia bacterium]
MNMKEYIKEIKEKFMIEYGESECSLNYENPLQLLIATQLATQCTDARVNIVMKDLVKKYPTCEDYASADLEELMDDIRSTGFYRNKAKNIIGTCKILLEKYDGEVPSDMDALTELPGVGRKIANLIRGDVYGIPGIVVDTHCMRLSGRMGLTKQSE